MSAHDGNTQMSLLRISITFLISAIAWCAFVLFSALDGCRLKPIAPSGDAKAFDRAIAARADSASKGSISLAILEAGEVRTMVHRSADHAVDEGTRFPVASVSKWIKVYGALPHLALIASIILRTAERR